MAHSAPRPVDRVTRNRRRPRNLLPYLLLLPGTALSVAILYPFFTGLYWSLSKYDLTLGEPAKFSGLVNYIKMFSGSGDAWLNIWITFLYSGLAVGVEVLIGFAVALMLQNEGTIFKVFRSAVVLPLLMPPVVATIMWKVMMTPNGVLNSMLNSVGLPAFGWLGSSGSAMPSVVLIDVWIYTPFVVLILLAGLQSVPEEVREAAKVDGATGWTEIRHIILPLLKPFLVVILILRGIDAFKSFDIIYTATQGGPVNATMTLHVQAYFTGIRHLKFGESMSHLVILWVLCYGLAFFLLIRIPFVSCRNRDSAGSHTPRPEPVFLLLAPLGLQVFPTPFNRSPYQIAPRRLGGRDGPMTTTRASASAPARPYKPRTKWGRVGAIFGLTVYTIFGLFPLYWILLMSLKVPQDVIATPPKFIFDPTLDNYRNVLSRPDFLEPFKNSLIITVGALLLSLVIGLPAAYALARMRFRGKEDFAFSFLSLRFAPELLVILPLFVIYRQLHLYNTYWGLILVYQLITFPLMVWMMRSFLEDVPREVEEAVTIDGGTWFTSFKMIAFRIALPGLAASVVLAFIYAWNNFVFGLILGGSDTQTITTGILQFISFQEVQWGPMAAAAILSIIPEFIIASFALRYMIRGLTAGIVK